MPRETLLPDLTHLAPKLATLIHPGDDTTEPFPMVLPWFQQQELIPDGLAQQQADELGLPSPDLNRLQLEAIVHLIETEGNVELVDKAELAALRTAAAANEVKRHAILEFVTDCGQPAFRAMVRDFDTDHPRISCDAAKHECRRAR